jgi:hypothetical protein
VTLAGALLAATGIGTILSTITNEALYPAERHRSTFADTISSLSGTEPPDSGSVALVAPRRWWPGLARRLGGCVDLEPPVPTSTGPRLSASGSRRR